MRPLDCRIERICKSIASSSGESPPNFIRKILAGSTEDNEESKASQGLMRKISPKNIILFTFAPAPSTNQSHSPSQGPSGFGPHPPKSKNSVTAFQPQPQFQRHH